MSRQSKPHLSKGVWRTRIRGVTHYLGTNERDAQARFHALMAEAMQDNDPTDRPSTLAGAVNMWLDLNPKPIYLQWAKPLVGFAADVRLHDVHRDFLTRYLAHLRQYTYQRTPTSPRRKLAAETLRHYIRTGMAILKWAHRQGWIRELPDPPKLARSMRRTRDVPLDELRDALAKLPERAGRILRFIAFTGCRPGEACRLEWKHVHLNAGLCIIDQHKTAHETGRPRTIYLTAEAAAVLRTMKPTTGYVFLNRFARPYKPSGLVSIMKRITGLTPYQLRHTFAQTASTQVPRDVLSKLLGHTNEATARFYYEVRDKRAISAAQTIKMTG